jgi:hypothetical protein
VRGVLPAAKVQNEGLDATSMGLRDRSMVRQVCELRSKGILDRDLTTSNVVFTSEGFAKISDVGSTEGEGARWLRRCVIPLPLSGGGAMR